MMAQIVSAALINECQVLATPASCGNIPTSGGKEDHVSMGMTAALKFDQIVANAERVLAIELICAAQGIEYRAPLQPARRVGEALARVRNTVRGLEQDRVLAPDIEALASALRSADFEEWRS
jgi:histidine ammonia-lyase